MEKKKNKSNFSLKRLIYNDKYLIIFSLLLAVLIWIIASINIGTDEVKTIKLNVPITLGDEVSEQLGMQYFSFQENIELSVSISGPKYVVGQATENDLSVKFDTSSVNRTGAQTIPILVTNSSKSLDFDVTGTYPASIDAYFDVYESKTFDLELEFDADNIADGYTFGEPILSEDKIVVSGPQSFVDKIDRAVVPLYFSDSEALTEPYNADCNIQIVGYGVETGYLTISSKADMETRISKVAVTLPVLKKTVLPVSVDLDGEPFDIGNNVSIWYSKSQITAGVLGSANIKKAVIGKIDYSQLKVGKNSFSFDITNLKGITVLEDVEKIDVVVYVSGNYTEQKIPVSINDVKIEGLDKGEKATVSSLDIDKITVVAPKGTTITENDIEIKCDVSEKKKDNLYPAQIVITSNNSSWVYDSYNATIEIK